MNPVHAGAFLGALFSVLAVSVPVMHAYAVPGWDEPFDPPAYYSPTAISYADSPSPFAIRELLGGQSTTAIQAKSASKILDNFHIFLSSSEVQAAIQLAKAASNSDTDANRFKEYVKGTLAAEMKRASASMGLGQQEKALLDGFIDVSLLCESDEAIEKFAKGILSSSEPSSYLLSRLKDTLTMTPNCYGTITVGSAIGGNGDIDVPVESGGIVGTGTPVYDYLREVQEILLSEKTWNLLEQLGIRTEHFRLQVKKLPSPVASRIDITLSNTREKMRELNTREEILDRPDIFGLPPRKLQEAKWDADKADELGNLSLSEKMEAITKEYQRIADTVKKNQEDVENMHAALKEIMEANANVEGEEQAWEVNSRAKALQTEIILRENIVQSQLVQLRAIRERWRIAREEAEKEMILYAAEHTKVDDPFDKKTKEFWAEYGYERHKVDPWPEFK